MFCLFSEYKLLIRYGGLSGPLNTAKGLHSVGGMLGGAPAEIKFDARQRWHIAIVAVGDSNGWRH